MAKKANQPNSFDPDVPVWCETPLDHWSKDIDPVLMAGDEWVADTRDPGAERIAEQQGGTRVGAPFMHPTHDTNYGLDHDADMKRDTKSEG